MKANTIKLVYIAMPYRGKTDEDVEHHIQDAIALAAVVMLYSEGSLYPIIPHVNGYALHSTHLNLPDGADFLDDDYWLAATLETMSRCDAVIFGPGWQNSAGCRGELDRCKESDLPHVFITVNPQHSLSWDKIELALNSLMLNLGLRNHDDPE